MINSYIDFEELRNKLYREGLDILMGMPYSTPYQGGPRYITFCNGSHKNEGDPVNFCGVDISFTDLLEATIDSIRETEDYQDSSIMYIRGPMELSECEATFNKTASGFTYQPASRYAYIRIAFGGMKND